MEYEIDFQPLDPITNNPSLDNDTPINPRRRARIAADRRDLRNGRGGRALAIPEEEVCY